MRQNQLKGSSEFSNDTNSPFIRINDVPRFIDWVKKIVTDEVESTIKNMLSPNTASDIKQILFEGFLNTKLRADIINNPFLSERYLGVPALSSSVKPNLKEGKTSEFIEWSYPEPNDENVFSEDKLKTLDCRAGLYDNQKLDKVVYRQKLDDCGKICKPTTFDAEFYPQFEPGGKTIPLTECDDREGFDEYVHAANRFKKLISIPVIIKK